MTALSVECDVALLDSASGDPRLAIVALLSQSLNAAGNTIVENIVGRAWRGARFAERLTAADTLVAARVASGASLVERI